MRQITIKGVPLKFEAFRKLDLNGWEAYAICAGPGQLYMERVQINSMLLTEDGELVFISKPFKNLISKERENDQSR